MFWDLEYHVSKKYICIIVYLLLVSGRGLGLANLFAPSWRGWVLETAIVFNLSGAFLVRVGRGSWMPIWLS